MLLKGFMRQSNYINPIYQSFLNSADEYIVYNGTPMYSSNAGSKNYIKVY